VQLRASSIYCYTYHTFIRIILLPYYSHEYMQQEKATAKDLRDKSVWHVERDGMSNPMMWCTMYM
jgi:hypothetical protein